ncbi:MAG: PSD1 and planctomycete cytochrome C domain-containing protein [Planctomycetota bacterium]
MHAPVRRRRGLAVLATAVAAVAGGGRAPANSPDHQAFFESRVRPLLVAKCQECHGPKVSEAGLRLDSRPAVLAGGQSGPVAVGGDAAHSRLIEAVKRAGDLQMPPDEPLSADEVAVLEQWVAAGMPWSGPGSGGPDDPLAASAAPLDMDARLREARAEHWAFRSPERHTPPAVPEVVADPLRGSWNDSAIDRFLARDIAAAGIAPSPQAPPWELVRRLSFDLTGLPPAAADVEAFASDPSDAAYAALVERLLASRAHAEHWARKWLDLARYADTMGYAFDGQASGYPFAWTYRDWVVRALHDDVPYDRFVTLQLAADLVEPAVPPADLAALGFLTVGRTFLGNQHDIIDDRIDLVTRGLLGLTVACARCHDHKYEPVTMADYYALHGIFASCEIPEELPVIGEPLPGPEAAAFAKKRSELQERVAAHERAVHERAIRDAVLHAADYLLETSRPLPRPDGRPPRLPDGYEIEQLLIDRLVRKLNGTPSDHPILGLWVAVRSLPDGQFAEAVAAVLAGWESDGAAPVNGAVRGEMLSARPTSPRALAEAYARAIQRAHAVAGTPEDAPDLAAIREAFTVPGAPLVVLPSEAMRVAVREEATEHRRRQRDVTEHEAQAPGGPPRAMVLRDSATPHDSRILLRGNPGRPGEPVPRRLPQLLGGTEVNREASGRLELARAITAPTNPLAARVIVNWAWTHHFGRGLVATPGDLGLRGEPPSHPELLDDLARRFVEEGGASLRWLHREIVTSRAWRQTSTIRPELAERDPDNLLYARANRRRLDWEAWRDALCTAAGTLDLAWPGGPGIDPVATDRMHARSLYARLDRQDVPGLLRTFDIANPDTAVHARTRTTVPQQALAALNAPLVVEAARRLAGRATAEAGGGGAEAFIERLWRAALARTPSADERALALEWLAAEGADPEQSFGPRERLAQAVLATAEFEFID